LTSRTRRSLRVVPPGKGRPVEFYAARLTGCGQRLLPLQGPFPHHVGKEASILVRLGGLKYVPTPSKESWTEVARLEVVRFDLEELT
jgi:hypothetical protein